MFNLSDRDAKIIMILLIVAVIAFPYVFYSKNTREDTEIQKARNVQLEERYAQLQEMNQNRQFYLDETARLDKERDLLIASFPADIRPENYTMFLLNMEYNSKLNAVEKMLEIEEDETLQHPGMEGIEGNTLVYVDTVGYPENDKVPISEEGAEDYIEGVVNRSPITFFCYYDGMKYILDYILNYEDPMIYKQVSLSYDPATGVVTGTMSLEQYAISGHNRELPPAEIWPDLDEYEIRGNEEVGIFGGLEESVLKARIQREAEEAEKQGDQNITEVNVNEVTAQ